MTRQLNIAGKNSNEVYTLVYPNNLINFCKYDFSLFLEHCTDLCRLAARSGEYNIEDVYSIRNSISGCHKYYEQNMRSIFEKIVIDCWIEYLCKQSDVGTGTLWQGFMRCRNDFERAIFSRLSDYRYNRAINEWTNLLKMQDYARTKVDFVFGVQLTGPQEAAARANYFDLVFNVAANEQGFPLNEIAATGVYSMGRLPNSPFIFSSAAREIARNQLNGISYIEGGYKSRKNPDLTDKTAMDAFAAIKDFIPSKNDSMAKTIIKSMSGSPQNIFMPNSFKAVIDLEIDMIAESGAVIQKCAGCGEYYLKDENYTYNYCDRLRRDGITCLEAAQKNNEILITSRSAEHIEAPIETTQDSDDDFSVIYVDKSVLAEKTDALYKEMAARVNVDMTQRDFSRWYQKELRLKERITFGEAGEKELNEFIELSHGDFFATKNRQEEPPVRPEPEEEQPELTENGKEIKKFVFERVERPVNQPSKPQQQTTLNQSEQAAMDAVKRLFAEKNAAQPVYQQPQGTPVHNMQGNVQGYRYMQQPQNYGYQQTVVPGYGYQQQPYMNMPQFGPQKPISRVIRAGAPAASNAQRLRLSQKTVAIPNFTKKQEEPEKPAPEFVPEPDVKVFSPRTPVREESSAFRGRNEGYIEPSPYERMRDEYMKNAAEEAPEPQIEGQISAEEFEPAPKAVAANAISAYRNTGVQSNETAEKADFSQVLNGIKRDDGFERDDVPVDSDGMPVSHKTKHVMNALFGQPKMSPFLRINLDDDDDN